MNSMKNCLSYWFPVIEAGGLPVPKTHIYKFEEHPTWLVKAFDGEKYNQEENAELEKLILFLNKAGDEMGWPCFLRSGQTSGKHSWKDTCFLPGGLSLRSHVLSIVEYGALACIMGLDFDVWVIREMLKPLTWFIAHEGMPVNTEIRAFIKDGKMICAHPYWPEDSVLRPSAEQWKELLGLNHWHCDQSYEQVRPLAEKVSALLPDDAWSVDFLFDVNRGWVLTDMATAQDSYHYPGCEEKL